MPDTSTAVVAENLVKVFGSTRAVDGVDLAVPAGTVYGLLGPNGAGKTTTVRILATLLRPDSGQARVFGDDVSTSPERLRSRIAVTGQFASVDQDLTGRENLLLQARLLGLSHRQADSRVEELLEGFDLLAAARRQVKTYSGGMHRRIDVASSIVVTPDLLFLDEPTTGLDPRSRNQVWEIVRALAAEGTTVLLTTQYLDEADRLADRIAVLDHGRVVADDTPVRLKSSVGTGVLRVQLDDPAQRPRAQQVLAEALHSPVDVHSDPAVLRARVRPGTDGQASPRADELVTHALRRMSLAGVGVAAFALDQPSLDEVFLALTGRPTDENNQKENIA